MISTDRNIRRALPWAALVLACAGLVLLGWSWSESRREAAALRTWQATMLHQIAAASDQDATMAPADASGALANIIASRDAATAMVATRPVPPRDDAATGGSQAASPLRPDAAKAEIARLSHTQSTGTAAGDAQIIDQDSRAAWNGWK
ncbi:hypothetical protein [Sphingomonas sp.]|uniref:hypothetical protein n=1 Tax=Sphingomonas sp. TaxID=28214 RepID=UPI002ED9A96F